jgi:hypothetical protein
MAVYKIFISSPGDVGRERHLAEQVIRRVAAEFQDRVEVQPYFWEYEPMESRPVITRRTSRLPRTLTW